MTKQELMRIQHLTKTLIGLGFTIEEVDKLRRISNALRRWFEMECGTDHGCVERDENGKPFFRLSSGRTWPVSDRETGARKRLALIIKEQNLRAVPVSVYIQTDPRGAALYILRHGDVPEGEDASAYYSRGVCVY